VIQLRYPVINANGANATAQIQSFLHQLIDDLNFALQDIDSQATQTREIATTATTSNAKEEKNPKASFDEIKSLIIKSADVVQAFYDEFSKRLEGSYVAQSDFGTYTQETSNTIKETSEGLSLQFNNLQEIIADIDIPRLIDVQATIRAGVLDEVDGVPIYGLEVGQETEVEGEKKFRAYARFTSNRMSFYDSNDVEVAYISDRRLHITHAEITGSLTLGGFVDTVLSDKSVITRWVVGGDQ